MPSPKRIATPPVDVALPTRGRIVDYTDAEGNIMPAIVTKVDDGAPHVEPVAGEGKPAEKPEKGEGREEREVPDRRGLHLQGWDSVLGCGHYYLEDALAAARKLPGEPSTWNWPVKDGNGEPALEPPHASQLPTR
jgi:hypothetical protein